VREKTEKDRVKVSITLLFLFVYHKKVLTVSNQFLLYIQLIEIND
jgi:hypothetical protein